MYNGYIQTYMTFIDNLNWRYAVKNFDTSKKISTEDLQTIKDAIRLAPSSFGLQPFKVLIIEDTETRQKLKEVSFDQPQVTDASHFLVFVGRSDFQTRISEYSDIVEKGSMGILDRIKFEASSRGFVAMKNEDEKKRYASEQAYLALGLAVAAASELKIDSAPMGGFMPSKYAEILGLEKDEEAVVVLALGYRAEDPKHTKVRFPESDLFKVI